MAHETNQHSGTRRELDFRNGTPVEATQDTAEPCQSDEDNCRRPTSHPTGLCSECRTARN